MYSYDWDAHTGGYILNTTQLSFSKEPRPVYYKELDILGFDKYWNYAKDDSYPYMWAEANNYIYRGRKVASTKGGSLYTAPELILEEAPEPDGKPLRFVDIQGMVARNADIIESLAQETIKKIYNTYIEYRDRVDVFYVAFSGGKDSIVTLDLVQRALPHNAFIVMFGDTGMEFPDTYDIVDQVEEWCKGEGIEFYRAKSEMSPEESWRKFGPPARNLRWCCSVHKTAPIVNFMHSICNASAGMRCVMITGVRADESSIRYDYDEISFGKKLASQYSFHPILEWSAAEIFDYIYQENLKLNPAYGVGFNRVGCIMCPNSPDKHEYIKNQCYHSNMEKYCDIISSTNKKDLSGNNRRLFLESGGWKLRTTGRELLFSEEDRVIFEESDKLYTFTVSNLKSDWKIWYRTVGTLVEELNTLTAAVGTQTYLMEYKGVIRRCIVSMQKGVTTFAVENLGKTKNAIDFIHLFKRVLLKTQYCIRCKVCEAECSIRCIEMSDDKVTISNKCTRCHGCMEIPSGCVYYNSIRESKAMKKISGVNKYLSVGVNAQWMENYFKDDTFEPGNRKTDVMYGFMGDAGIVYKRKMTKFGQFVKVHGLIDVSMWALMLCNLVYTPAFGWYVLNVPFGMQYSKIDLDHDMGEDVTEKARGEFWQGFKTILDTITAMQKIGFGVPDISEKTNKNGEVRKTLNSIIRTPWKDPDPLVILYSLYKYAEACGGDCYTYTLTRLLNYDIECDGVSPTLIFGLGREEMEPILLGLSTNYPEFINASFTHDLDTVDLRADKTSADVLELF